MGHRHRDPIVAVASRSFSETDRLREELTQCFGNAKFNETGRTLHGHELIEFVQNADAIIVGLERVDGAFLNATAGLRFISKYGVGLNNIDLPACQAAGVKVLHTPGVNSYSVAELALSSAIQLLHRTPESQSTLREGVWRQHRGRDLRGATVGVVGCGHVGQQLVRLLSPFGCQVLAHDLVNYLDFFAAWNVTAVSLEELLSESDVVTIHLPLDSSTRGMFSDRRLSLMKPGAVLLNYSRGGILDESATAERAQAELLAGVAIDVYAEEPSVSSPLLGLPNVLSTAHIGGSTLESVLAMGRAATQRLTEVYSLEDGGAQSQP
jgi:D-3-phosphoglycerate dehydrogenase